MTTLRMPPGRTLLLCTLSLLSSAAWAQSNNSGQTELIQQLLQRIDQLERRVTELEAAKPGAGLAAPNVVTQAAPAVHASPVPGEHDHGTAVEPQATYPSLKIAGFSDMDFSASDQKGTHSGFSEGQFILHLSSALSSKVNYFGEISMTARTDAGTGSPAVTGFNVEVERSIIRFDQSDHLKLSFGRYHTPISYWNTAFHHGSWLQTTV
ncbi:MAG TPA: hypothetical protein VGH38_02430, partial [Bryobacteraceae bacterium]